MDPSLQAALTDRYRVERELGGGGMSRVYLAEETALGRQVVIKVIAPDLAEGLSAERFEREVKLAARLQQANIVPVLTAGDAAGLPYYIMPYVDGQTLRASFGATPVAPSALADSLSILRDVARALSYAHAHGIVHRDIKPENILLSGGAAVVTDFGIAKAISESRTRETGSSDAALTQAGNSIGTPAYMAPEQAVGAPVDHRADLYAWGVVAYELLSGAHPFAHRSGTQQLIAAHIAEVPTPLAAKAPSLPRQVTNLVMQCLEKDPARRPASADLLVKGLSTVTVSGGTRRWAPVAAMALLGLVAGFYLWKGKASTPAAAAQQDRRVIAILPLRNVSQDTAQQYFSAGMTEEIASQLGKVAALRILGRAATTSYDTVTNRLQRMGRELGVGSVVDGSVQLAGDRVRVNVNLTDVRTGVSLWSEKYDREVKDLFAVQDDVARKVAAALQTRLTDDEAYRLTHAPTTDIEAYQLYLRAKVASPTQRGASQIQADLLRQAIQRDTAFALAWAYLGRNFMFRAIAGEPALMDSGFAAARRAIALDPRLADGYFALGDLLSTRWKLSEAREAYLKALQLSPSHDGVLADLSNVLLTEGKYDEGLDMAVRASQINPRHQHVPYHVGIALMFLGDDSATSRYLRTAESERAAQPRTETLIAWLELRGGDSATALDQMRRTVRGFPEDAESDQSLAEMAAMVGTDDAEALLKRQVERDPGMTAQYSPANMRSLYAMLIARRGDSVQAQRLWTEAIRNTESQMKGAEGPYGLLELASVAAMQGRTTDALDLLERAHQAGFRDPRQLGFDPSFAAIRTEPRFRALMATMEQELVVQRQRAAAAHPELFTKR